MNDVEGAPVSFNDLLKIREEILGVILAWEVNGMVYCGPINGWVMDAQSLVIRLGWLKGKSETEWRVCEPKGFCIPFKKSEITLVILNGNIVISEYDKYAKQQIGYIIHLRKSWATLISLIASS